MNYNTVFMYDKYAYDMARQFNAFNDMLARKMRSCHAFGTLARKPR